MGIFIGLVDYGSSIPVPKCQNGDHALVFLFQPVLKGWKQVIGTFCAKGATLEAIIKLEKCGALVHAIICDGVTTNKSALKTLGISVSKKSLKFYFKNPVDDNRDICGIFDVPHIFKCIRNLFISKKQFSLPDGLVKIDHLETAYLEDQKNPPDLKVLPKIKDAHLYPNNFQKQNVQTAVQAIRKFFFWQWQKPCEPSGQQEVSRPVPPVVRETGAIPKTRGSGFRHRTAAGKARQRELKIAYWARRTEKKHAQSGKQPEVIIQDLDNPTASSSGSQAPACYSQQRAVHYQTSQPLCEPDQPVEAAIEVGVSQLELDELLEFAQPSQPANALPPFNFLRCATLPLPGPVVCDATLSIKELLQLGQGTSLVTGKVSRMDKARYHAHIYDTMTVYADKFKEPLLIAAWPLSCKGGRNYTQVSQS
uniref:Transposable element P transposase-like RNase H domain-containing protein n=1 Tax=Strigamia maritima TaxID=126957 RepID=T1J2D5_STRMM